jgi:hypothetical protein
VSASDEDILMQYLKDTSEIKENITAAPCLKKLFINQQNISLPRCAAALSALFSCCMWADYEQQMHKTE